MRRWAAGLVVLAGLMGVAGVLLAAAGAHEGGGELARTSSVFLLVHAAATIGLVAWALGRGSRIARLTLAAASVLALGTVVFSGDLAALAFLHGTAVPMAAPLGGSALLAGWLLVVVAGIVALVERSVPAL